MMSREITNAKEKILEAASTLFYKQGYQATTIDQVIACSGVSRPTLYVYFSTKEELCIAYLKARRKVDLELVKEAVDNEPSPHGKFMSIIKFVKNFMLKTEYRGCGYFNMISEFPDGDNAIVREARIYVDSFREIIRDVIKDIKSSESKYKTLNVDRMADVYYVIVCGAIMASQEYREPWPLNRAVEEVESLLRR